MTKLLLYTDLDGTLLDSESYAYDAALPALDALREWDFPLVLVSSKTRGELVVLHRELGLSTPFICENGAAVHWQENGQPSQKTFATSRDELLKVIHKLRTDFAYQFTGFADCTLQQVCELTGLDAERAALAMAREYTEPLLWQDSDERREAFCAQLNSDGLRAVQGGRFLSVMGQFDKCTAMAWLTERYRAQEPFVTVALGDSPNDEAMLCAADIAVVIKSARSDELTVRGPQWVIRTAQPGPLGWRWAVEEILQKQGAEDE